MRLAMTFVALLILASCAGMSRMGSYGYELADAKVRVGHREYSLYFHPTDATILIQRGFGAAMGQALGEGLTLNAVNMAEPMPIWRAAADAVLGEVGCRTVDVYTLDNNITWEATYTCDPAGTVDATVIASNRSRWRAGLQVESPMSDRR